MLPGETCGPLPKERRGKEKRGEGGEGVWEWQPVMKLSFLDDNYSRVSFNIIVIDPSEARTGNLLPLSPAYVFE